MAAITDNWVADVNGKLSLHLVGPNFVWIKFADQSTTRFGPAYNLSAHSISFDIYPSAPNIIQVIYFNYFRNFSTSNNATLTTFIAAGSDAFGLNQIVEFEVIPAILSSQLDWILNPLITNTQDYTVFPYSPQDQPTEIYTKPSIALFASYNKMISGQIEDAPNYEKLNLQRTILFGEFTTSFSSSFNLAELTGDYYVGIKELKSLYCVLQVESLWESETRRFALGTTASQIKVGDIWDENWEGSETDFTTLNGVPTGHFVVTPLSRLIESVDNSWLVDTKEYWSSSDGWNDAYFIDVTVNGFLLERDQYNPDPDDNSKVGYLVKKITYTRNRINEREIFNLLISRNGEVVKTYENVFNWSFSCDGDNEECECCLQLVPLANQIMGKLNV
jgi:hypothetical protein